MKGVTMPWQSS